MKRLILVQMALALIALPSPSEAGIVVIDMREPSLAMKAENRTEDEAEEKAGAEDASGQETTREAKGTRPTRTWDGASVWSTPSDSGAETQPALEQTEGVQPWVEVEEEPGIGPAGCGGAQAARGPAGLLPLALAAAALLLTRRRT